MLEECLSNRGTFIKLALIFDVVRVFAAGGWTYISSSEHLLFHEVCFVFYVVLSFIWMGIHTPLFYAAKVKPLKGNASDAAAKNILFSFRWKLVCATIQVTMFIVSLYFFLIEHQQKCLAGAYSKYALCEWILSACNILYDASCYLDFKNTYFTLPEKEKKGKE